MRSQLDRKDIVYLQKLTLRNIRGFRTGNSEISLNFTRPGGEFAGWTVIAGRNGAGKSTLLRAIALAIAGPEVARSLVPRFEGWVSKDKTDALVVANIVASRGDSDGGYSDVSPGTTLSAGLRWTQSPDGPEPSMRRINEGEYDSLGSGPWSQNPRGWFLAGYGPFRRLTGGGDYSSRSFGYGKGAALVTLFDETASLAESTRWLQELYPRVLEKDHEAIRLQTNVLALLNDGLLPDGSEVLRYDSNGLWIRQRNIELILEEMADGYRVVSALVLDIVRRIFDAFGSFDLERDQDGRLMSQHQGIVLIDEVDAHLHVSWQQSIGFWLREHFPRVQFIVSTHSPFITQAASARGLLRLAAPDERSRAPKFVEEPLFSSIVNGGADRSTMSELFGLESVYSQETRNRRDQWRELETTADLAPSSSDLAALRSELGVGVSDEVALALKSLDEAIRDLDA